MDTKKTSEAIITGIKGYFQKHNLSKAVIGLSGGIDSSITAFLSARALGSENVTGILMPEEGLTSDSSVNDAMEVVNILKINNHKIPINNLINNFNSINKTIFNNKNQNGNKNNEIAIANSKARIRMSILYYFANINNALVIGTSNKSETVLGYATKYGDAASDILPIGDLWKTQVIELAKYLGVPEKIINKKPTAELVAGVTDESELGAPYEIIDKILKLHFEKKAPKDEIISDGFDRKLVENVLLRIKVNEHKGRMPTVVRVV